MQEITTFWHLARISERLFRTFFRKLFQGGNFDGWEGVEVYYSEQLSSCITFIVAPCIMEYCSLTNKFTFY